MKYCHDNSEYDDKLELGYVIVDVVTLAHKANKSRHERTKKNLVCPETCD